jgi:nitrate reductase NapE component
MINLLSERRNNLIKIIALSISIFVIYVLVYLLGLQNHVQGIMIFLIVSVALIGGYKLCQKFDTEMLVRYIIFIGLVMRIGYMLYTPCTVRFHDLKEISIESDGNAA